jgi:hypothetical protein
MDHCDSVMSAFRAAFLLRPTLVADKRRAEVDYFVIRIIVCERIGELQSNPIPLGYGEGMR